MSTVINSGVLVLLFMLVGLLAAVSNYRINTLKMVIKGHSEAIKVIGEKMVELHR